MVQVGGSAIKRVSADMWLNFTRWQAQLLQVDSS